LNAAEPNPGKVGYGVSIFGDAKLVAELSAPIDHGANNVSEYSGLIAALDWLEAQGVSQQRIQVNGDCKPAVEQMKGNWRIKKTLIAQLGQEALTKVENLFDINFDWVPRECNMHADRL
jgi:ribonuclease HI